MEIINNKNNAKELLFSNKALIVLIIPLIIERFLDLTAGIADMLMVTIEGEAAVSAIALVDNVNNLVLFLLAALATGGAVVISQYIGRDDIKSASIASTQLLYVSLSVSLILMGVALVFNRQFLELVFGELEPDVMAHARMYLYITSISYPFVAVFGSISAIYRSMGISKLSMFTSLIMNIVDISLNALFIYVLRWSVFGAAVSTLGARVISAVVMMIFIHKTNQPIYFNKIYKVHIEPVMVRNILRIGIPSGLENGMFHLGRLMVQSLISTFGTAAIAANAIAGMTGSIIQVPGSGMALAVVTITGTCIGAGDYDQATNYMKRIMRYIYITTSAACVLLFIFSPSIMRLFNLSDEAVALSITIVRNIAVACPLFWIFAFPFPNFLRAAGDVKYTMIVSLISMWTIRVGLSYVIASAYNLGVMGVWYCMFADWAVRGAVFLARYKGNKWRHFKVI